MASGSHAAVLHPKIESAVSPDEALVSITMHGIAACREVKLNGNSASPASMTFSRVMNPTDLLDKTILLEMPIVSTYTIDDPCGTPATITMLAERLGVGSQHMTLRSNGVDESVTHCNLTLNNGTVTTQPAISSRARSFYRGDADVALNNGMGMREASTSPYLNSSKKLPPISQHMHKRYVRSVTVEGDADTLIIGYKDDDHTTPTYATKSATETSLKAYFNSGDASRGKQYCTPNVNYWPNNIRAVSNDGDTVAAAGLTNNNAPYAWGSFPKITSVQVVDTVFCAVPHDLLDSESTDECLSNIRFFDLRMAIPDVSEMFTMSRDFNIPWTPYIDPTLTTMQTRQHSHHGRVPIRRLMGGVDAVTDETFAAAGDQVAMGRQAAFCSSAGGTKTTTNMIPLMCGASAKAFTVADQNFAAVSTLGTLVADVPVVQPSAQFGLDKVQKMSTPAADQTGWKAYYLNQDPRTMIRAVDHTFEIDVGVPKLHMRLYQSAVPVPRALSFGITTDIVRSMQQQLEAQGTAAPFKKQLTRVNTDSFSLSEVPQAIYIFGILEGQSFNTVGDRLSTPPQLANITGVNFRTTANTGTLSTATPRQLYQMCQRNGCNQTFTEFVNDGNVICIKPSKDLGGWVEGARETFTHDFEIQVVPPCQDLSLNARQLDTPDSAYHQIFEDNAQADKHGKGILYNSNGAAQNYAPAVKGALGANANYQLGWKSDATGTDAEITKNILYGQTTANGAMVAEGMDMGALPGYTPADASFDNTIGAQDLYATYAKLKTLPAAMRSFAENTFTPDDGIIPKVTIYTVYEMVGSCHLQADGLMQTTSGFDTSTIVNTLQGPGLSHGADVATNLGGVGATMGGSAGRMDGSGVGSGVGGSVSGKVSSVVRSSVRGLRNLYNTGVAHELADMAGMSHHMDTVDAGVSRIENIRKRANGQMS